MLPDPGAIAEPIRARSVEPMRRTLRAWNASEVRAMRGETTAWTRDSEFGTQVWVLGLAKSVPMYDSCTLEVVSLRHMSNSQDGCLPLLADLVAQRFL